MCGNDLPSLEGARVILRITLTYEANGSRLSSLLSRIARILNRAMSLLVAHIGVNRPIRGSRLQKRKVIFTKWQEGKAGGSTFHPPTTIELRSPFPGCSVGRSFVQTYRNCIQISRRPSLTRRTETLKRYRLPRDIPALHAASDAMGDKVTIRPCRITPLNSISLEQNCLPK